jgi:hypothetical protein
MDGRLRAANLHGPLPSDRLLARPGNVTPEP